MSNRKQLYRVQFFNQGKVYEVYARGVSHGALMGFVEIQDLMFGERSNVVVDPSEEKLKSEFEGVRRTYVPMHAIIRIDEVLHGGTAKISDAEGKVTPFPVSYYGPGDRKP